ncbi:MAG: hypothetical protein BGN86_02080 [Caulobacterales bacterium 68-7]|nr:MAG: hypothetical protein BGN86_02080 [Caulobacterales bacterium 68-7]
MAKATSTTGATKLPSRLEPRFCATPWARPRCFGSTSLATIAWLIGMTPPSAAPIRRREPSSRAKLEARPVRNEQSENAMVAAISSTLRWPRVSESLPIPKAAMAQLKLRPPAIRPICVCVRPRSGCTNGIRAFSACRSKNTIPKFRLRRTTRRS